MRTVTHAPRLIALGALLTLLAACGPRTPDDLVEEAETAMSMGDPVEAELLLQKLFAMEDLPPEIAVEAHMLRAVNFMRGLEDPERALQELEAIVDLVGPSSADGLNAVMALARVRAQEEGLAGWDGEIERLIGETALEPDDELSLAVQRWQVLTNLNASPEKREMFPQIWAQVASAEFLGLPDRRGLALNLARDRAMMALATDNIDDAVEAFDLFIEGYPGSEPAEFMAIEVASHLRAAGREEEARARAEAGLAAIDRRLASAETAEEEATTLLMKADALQMLGEMEEADATYLRIFDTYLDFQHRPRAMLGWGLALAQSGSVEEALQLLNRTALEYPNSPFSTEANRMMAAIEAMLAAQASPEAAAQAAPATAEVTPPLPVSPEVLSPETAS